MSFLQLDGLVKHFGNFSAVEGLSLSIEKGEFLSLLGPSGCGKTTTLQMIAGFVEPTRGRIVVEGRDITGLRPERRGMGVVFQSYALFPHMTVGENVGFGLEMRNVPRRDRVQRVAETLELVRLTGLEHRHPGALSGGQRQRVALARALAIRPALLLLDEPMSNLDAKLREEMHIELRSIQRYLGITTILVTHDQVEAMTMSDRVAVMYGGRIVQLSTPFEAYERPQTQFASTFLGRTNSVSAAVVASDDRCCEIDLAGYRMSIPHEGRQYQGKVDVYLRPERIRVHGAGEGLAGKVANRVFLGNHWMLEIDTQAGRLRVSQPNQGHVPPAEGAEVGLSWPQDAPRLLPAEEDRVH